MGDLITTLQLIQAFGKAGLIKETQIDTLSEALTIKLHETINLEVSEFLANTLDQLDYDNQINLL